MRKAYSLLIFMQFASFSHEYEVQKGRVYFLVDKDLEHIPYCGVF